jgi:hypothetical protein
VESLLGGRQALHASRVAQFAELHSRIERPAKKLNALSWRQTSSRGCSAPGGLRPEPTCPIARHFFAGGKSRPSPGL